MSKKKKSQKQKLSQAPLLKQEVSESASEVEKESVSPETQPESGQDDNKSSHEAFLDAYQRREQYDLGAGYAEWLKSNGSKTDASYAAAVKDATLAYDRALEGYGAKGEKLVGLGLDEGGYSAYLSSQRAHVRDAALAEAREQYDADRLTDEKGYAAYLRSRNSQTATLFKSLTASGISDYQTAYDYAISMGATPDNAEMVAILAGEWADKTEVSGSEGVMRLRVIGSIIDLELPHDAAYAYALACGLNDSTAKEVADAATDALEKRYGYKVPTYFY